ncbi:hypothetical protein DVA67_004790 [Solirubrobacter sp. CPCC 204708]|nr:hypothetical protein [Solirubrobacter deserti]
MHPSAKTAGGRRVTRWTRESIIEKIQEWNELYGEPPCSADWNPSLARWRAQEWRAERYRDGIWPSTNAAKRPFDGSFDAAVRAAGLEPHRSGPRRRPARTARPAVEQRAPEAVPRSVNDALVEADEREQALERRVAELERAVSAAERRASRAEDLLDDARARARRAGDRERRARLARDRVREANELVSVEADSAVADAGARVRAAYDQAAAAVAESRDARRAATAAEARAAEAEARADAAERLLEAATSVTTGTTTYAHAGGRNEANGGAATRGSTANGGGAVTRGDDARGSSAVTGGAETRQASREGDSPLHATDVARGLSEAEVDARIAAAVAQAQAESGGAVAAAMAAARAAEDRAAVAERRARELATLVCGEPRQLTRAELADLRDSGPTGPAVMANALKTLHRARAAGDRRGLTDALGDVASAAVGWRDRL